MKPTFLIILIFSQIALGEKEQFGFHVSLLIDGAKFCSGSLITEKFVITAGSCVLGASEVSVTLGITSLLKYSKTAFLVTSFVIHEAYRSQQSCKCHDLALIEIPDLSALAQNYTTLELPLPGSPEDDEEAILEISGFNLDSDGLLGFKRIETDEDCSGDNGSDEGTQQKNFFYFTYDTEEGADFRNIGSPVFSQTKTLFGIVVDIEHSMTTVLKIDNLAITDWISSKTD